MSRKLTYDEVQDLLKYAPEILLMADELGYELPPSLEEEARARLDEMTSGDYDINDDYEFVQSLGREWGWYDNEEGVQDT